MVIPYSEYVSKSTRRGKNKGCKVTSHKRLAIYIRDSFACVYCEQDLRNARPMDITLDHLVAQTNGGTNQATNLVTACRKCNCSRQDKDVAVFASRAAISRIFRLVNQPINPKLALELLAA